MKSSPWLDVAVKVRAPVADAPMHADIAPNSDSTIRYSQGLSSPVRTMSDSASTMCVCGEIGYAGITSGRQSATARATAWDPSICLSIGETPPLLYDVLEGIRSCHGIGIADRTREPLPDGTDHRGERDDPGQRCEPAEQRRIGERAPEALPGEVGGGNRYQPVWVKAA